ncbi:hypothetical protein PS858_01965 [Pseudomonas fluorescens]|jgi:hypothetical protein|uniref:Uncharacterized protein n=1 Tax=Pseudomonas fluorescens TaxID=294 RepID=A0A5E6QX75_PSEFL|nr:hypothetical protein PS676_01236 [Pseudomonas fluorescens]VVO06894.1 hypothetical protein PS704_03120 [Pseudomonas fluorescens]VVO84502.1 hypothetical protein PS858_01965 [Pseudomonas fluorescens]
MLAMNDYAVCQVNRGVCITCKLTPTGGDLKFVVSRCKPLLTFS